LVKYRNIFPKYQYLNWISISEAQRQAMPPDTNWVGNVYHGLQENLFQPVLKPKASYIAYMGRIIEPKGLHLAIKAVQQYNTSHNYPYDLKIAGKHYAGYHKDGYWQRYITPSLNDQNIQYVGFIDNPSDKQSFLGSATALIVPSIFAEPFGMVAIEALACATPVICLDSGALPEIINHGVDGLVVKKSLVNNKPKSAKIISDLSQAIGQISKINRQTCRDTFMTRFTAKRMCEEYKAIYSRLLEND
jgi:glycosyltransferase involved in cell wall biosynthesis